MAINDFKDLVVWQEAMSLALDCHGLVAGFPSNQRYALSDQIWRSCLAVPSNIAEGYGRGTTRDYLRFLRMARGSLRELETQLLLCQQLGLPSADTLMPILARLDRVNRLLTGLIKSLKG